MRLRALNYIVRNSENGICILSTTRVRECYTKCVSSLKPYTKIDALKMLNLGIPNDYEKYNNICII